MKNQTRQIRRLLQIMDRLRGRHGCPWDREQTHTSIRHNLIEECYEAIEALDGYAKAIRKRPRGKQKLTAARKRKQAIESFKQELGDLLLQIVFHAQMASENHSFTFEDVAKAISDKLVRRHPHIFGAAKVENSDEVLQQWELIKKTERNSASLVGATPQHLPALLKADKIQRKVARVGFDWKNAQDVVRKVEEEFQELKEALLSGNRREFEEELGDLLFATVNLARYEGAQAEELLNRCVEKFIARFQKVEHAIASTGRRIDECSPEELDAFWESAKGKRHKKRRQAADKP